MEMGILYFVLGLLTGASILLLYIKSVKAKWVRKIGRNDRIFELVENSKDLIYHFQLKPENKYIYVSPSIEKMIGPGLVERCYQNPHIAFDYVHPEDHAILTSKMNETIDYSKPVLQRYRDHMGNYKWFEDNVTPIYENGELVALVGIIRDISEKVILQQELQYLSTHDNYTGVYNRNYFEQTMARYTNEIDCSISIVLCDLDELKFVNDTYGHSKGDLLIKETAKLIQGFFSDNAVVARIGGDEFAIILPNTTLSQVEVLCKEFYDKLTEYNGNSDDLQINLSMGYASSEHSLENMESLFAETDKNMYQNKNGKKQKKSFA